MEVNLKIRSREALLVILLLFQITFFMPLSSKVISDAGVNMEFNVKPKLQGESAELLLTVDYQNCGNLNAKFIAQDIIKPEDSILINSGEEKAKDNTIGNDQILSVHPAELLHQKVLNKRKPSFDQMSECLNARHQGKYSIWRREYENPYFDFNLKFMEDQVIMARVYQSIAKSKKQHKLFGELSRHIKDLRSAIGEVVSDIQLPNAASTRSKEMAQTLLKAKEKLYDCPLVNKKLRAMVLSNEESIKALKKKNRFLTQAAVKSTSKSLICLSLQLTTDYYLLQNNVKHIISTENMESLNLYHYAIFSDNILATSVVVNSTVFHAKEPKRHVFHIVTDRRNFAAMQMWFFLYPPKGAMIEIKCMDDFNWFNSSYSPIVKQIDSMMSKEYLFHTSLSSSYSYKNPKYLSTLNHLRFYLPEIYPNLEKILFLDDDVVVQRDLSELWSINLQGKVNGAVKTCRENFHLLYMYLNFSDPAISGSFNPNSCVWAFGMNIFDLKEWRKQDISGIYHRWQLLNKDKKLWEHGSLSSDLIAFYNSTFPLERSWHLSGLGYDPTIDHSEIESAAVIHYSGNYKPWKELGIARYKHYWSKYVIFDSPYLEVCNINP